MTIRELLKGRATLDQFTILQRADVMFATSVGRYYGGLLDDTQVALLTHKEEPRNALRHAQRGEGTPSVTEGEVRQNR